MAMMEMGTMPSEAPVTFWCLCFSNVSVHVDTEQAISLFLRGPHGTIWSFHNPRYAKFGVSQSHFNFVYEKKKK